MSSEHVESADFAEKMAETVSVMKGLALTIAGAPGRNGHLAHASSVGMSDLAAQGVLQRRCPQWEGPVGDSYSIGAMTLIAASDYGHGYASLFEVSERAPVFAHLALTRAGLEACVVSIWLNDPRIDTERRVKRGLCEQLYSTWEVGRLTIDDEQQRRIAGAKAFWQGCADAFGWEISNNRGKPVVGGEQRPSMPVRISELVVGRGDKPIGKALWSYLSAVIHVGWYGVTPAVVEKPPSEPGVGPSLAMVGTDSKDVNPQSYGFLRALRQAGEARQTLMGWTRDQVWQEAAAKSEAHEEALLKAIADSAQQRG
jgi:hypothetical protein